MMFIVALYLPWCRYLQPQLYADNLKCVSWDPGVLLRAARFTTGYVRLVGQEPAPSKCVLMSKSGAVRWDMRSWIVTDEGHRWSVKLDVRDLGEGEGGIWILLFGVGPHFCSPAGFSWETSGYQYHVYSWCFAWY